MLNCDPKKTRLNQVFSLFLGLALLAGCAPNESRVYDKNTRLPAPSDQSWRNPTPVYLEPRTGGGSGQGGGSSSSPTTTEPKEPSTLVQNYWNRMQLQEAFWLADEEGDSESAEELFSQTFHTLRSSDYTIENFPVSPDDVTRGVSEKWIFRFKNGVKALFKPDAPHQSRFGWVSCAKCEAAAYSLDHAMHLNIVPMTLIINKGSQMGSAQYFVQQELESGEGVDTDKFKRMTVLDYIIGNTDRHENNWLYWADREWVVAVDHGLSFQWMSYADDRNPGRILKGRHRVQLRPFPYLGFPLTASSNNDFSYDWEDSGEDIVPLIRSLDSKVKQRILSLSESDAREVLEPLINDPSVIDRVVQRIANVQLIFQDQASAIKSTWSKRPMP